MTQKTVRFHFRVLSVFGQKHGAALMLTFLLMLVLSGFALGAGIYSHNSMVSGKSYLEDKQALYIAEAGLERARQQIEAGNWSAASSPGNEYNESFAAASTTAFCSVSGGYLKFFRARLNCTTLIKIRFLSEHYEGHAADKHETSQT